MRILWLTHRDLMNPRSGGAERTVFEVGRRLVSRGHTVEQASLTFPGARVEDTLEGVRVRRFDSALNLHLSVGRLTHEIAPDVVVDDLAHVVPWRPTDRTAIPGVAFFRHLHARTLGGQVRIPAAATLRLIERTYSLIYRSWPIVTESRQSYSDLVRLGVPANQIRVIAPGADTRSRITYDRAKEPTVVYFGGLKSYKRPQHALVAFDRLLKQNKKVKFVLVGDGPELKHLRELSLSLGLSQQVSIVGRLSDLQLSQIVSSAWVNVHCSSAEGWCYSAMEAAALGVPTVAYRAPGVSETILDNVSGKLVEDGNIEELATAIFQILQSPHGWWNSAANYSLRYRWDRTATDWERLLEASSSRQKFHGSEVSHLLKEGQTPSSLSDCVNPQGYTTPGQDYSL